MGNCVAVFRNYGSQCDRSYAVTASQFDRNETWAISTLMESKLEPKTVFLEIILAIRKKDIIKITSLKVNVGEGESTSHPHPHSQE